MSLLCFSLPLLLLAGPVAAWRAAHRPARHEVTFKKTVLDTRYISEGVAVADVNHDGKLDILAGNLWFEGPNWTPHEIAPVPKLDPASDHSNSYVTFAADINGDGWVDEIVIGRPGEKAYWRENPGNKPGYWKEHLLRSSACNESPAFVDLLGNKKPVLVFAFDEKYMAWYEPGKDVTQEFESHVISDANAPGTPRYSHGLGVGDINGDGRLDVLCRQGYWAAPADRKSGPWKFVPVNLGPECAQMCVYDVNGDGLNDVVTSSAHKVGVWWYEQKRGPNGPEFVQHLIDDSFSQTHAMVMADINGDGQMDFVTGKRFWAHGPKGDVDPNAPAVLNWYEFRRRDGKVEWIKHEIDHDSGVGTQFTVTDVNGDGLPDIVIANKKGIFYFEQQK